MQKKRNNNLILKVIVLGGLIAILIYVFHPGVGTLGLIINGEPVADPLTRIAAIPTLFFTLLLMAVLLTVAFFGFGIMMFMAVLMFSLLSVLLMAPYFWPILVIIFLVISIMSISEKQDH